MMIKSWGKLPREMQNDTVNEYYNFLRKKNPSLLVKRLFDIIFSILLIVLCSLLFIVTAIIIKTDSRGKVFYTQQRVTQYGRYFKIIKFRTMVANADQIGTLVTIHNDSRVTNCGEILRKYRLDEIPQLFNILTGSMSFVGTRPEVPKYVEKYSPEMLATLLIPAGVTSEAAIMYKDENSLLHNSNDIDTDYITKILPAKMKYNLVYIKNFSLLYDLKIIYKTIIGIFRKESKQ